MFQFLEFLRYVLLRALRQNCGDKTTVDFVYTCNNIALFPKKLNLMHVKVTMGVARFSPAKEVV